MNINLTLSLIAIIGLVFVAGFLIWLLIIFKDLIKISKNKDFSDNTKSLVKLKKDFEYFKELSLNNIQRVGLVKYNPFDEAGGEHSFSLALLDGKKNGIIITSLHTRERTRTYIKEIHLAKAKIELSKEEQKALQLSMK